MIRVCSAHSANPCDGSTARGAWRPFLDTCVIGICDINITGRIYEYAGGTPELIRAITRPVTAGNRYSLCGARRPFQDPVVLLIGYIHITGIVDVQCERLKLILCIA